MELRVLGCARSESGDMKQFRLVAALALGLAMLVLEPGSAQTSSGVSALGINVSPAKLELSMPAGSTYNIPVTVQNGSSAPTHILSSLVDFGLNQRGDYQFGKVGDKPYSLMRWASINPKEFDLNAGNFQQVRVSLAIPKEALSGEYSGIVFFATRPTRQQHGVAFSVRIATTVYVTIPGTVKIGGAIAKMSASGDNNAENYRVLFRNTGNAHVYVGGNLEVRKDGQLVERIPLPANQLVERGEDRLIEVSGKALPAGKYQAIALIDYGGPQMTGGEIQFDKN